MKKLKNLIAADLEANTGRKGLRSVVAELVWHPGFAAIFWHRISQRLAELSWHRLANLIWRHNVRSTGCHIHPNCCVGPGLALPHPTGIVIGSGAVIGPHVTIYQGVTLGKGHRDNGYPTIGASVVLYPGAIVAGNVSVGDSAIVGALCFVNYDVPPGATVVAQPGAMRPVTGSDTTAIRQISLPT